eukprot:5826537-Prymnesium_polylepis.1
MLSALGGRLGRDGAPHDDEAPALRPKDVPPRDYALLCWLCELLRATQPAAAGASGGGGASASASGGGGSG